MIKLLVINYKEMGQSEVKDSVIPIGNGGRVQNLYKNQPLVLTYYYRSKRIDGDDAKMLALYETQISALSYTELLSEEKKILANSRETYIATELFNVIHALGHLQEGIKRTKYANYRIAIKSLYESLIAELVGELVSKNDSEDIYFHFIPEIVSVQKKVNCAHDVECKKYGVVCKLIRQYDRLHGEDNILKKNEMYGAVEACQITAEESKLTDVYKNKIRTLTYAELLSEERKSLTRSGETYIVTELFNVIHVLGYVYEYIKHTKYVKYQVGIKSLYESLFGEFDEKNNSADEYFRMLPEIVAKQQRAEHMNWIEFCEYSDIVGLILDYESSHTENKNLEGKEEKE